MPVLKTFTSRFQGLPISGGRAATAADFGGEEAKATGELASTTAKVGEAALTNVEETESRRALVGTTEIRARYSRELDAAAQTGANTEDIKIKMDADLAKVGEEFRTSKGKALLDMYSANTHLGFDEQANRIEVQRAAATARIEGAKYMNASSAILMGNPHALAQTEQGVDALMATFTRIPPHERAEMAQKLKQNLNMTAAMATARIEPKIAKRKLENGEWNLTSEQRETALNQAEQVMNAQRAADNHARAQAEFERKQRDEAATRKYTDAIILGTLTGKALERALTSDADLDSNSVKALTLFAEHRAEALKKGEKVSDPTVRNDLWLRIHAPDTDPRKIFNGDAIFAAVEKGQLNTTDANTLLKQVGDMKDENNRSFGTRLQARMTTVGAALRSSFEYSSRPELQAAILNEMVAQVEQQSAALRKENKDPNVLLDPSSKDYYFKPDVIKTVARDVQQRMNAALPLVPTVRTQAEYDALPPGPYIDSRGNPGVKPERRKAAESAPAPVSERRAAQRGSQESLLIPQPNKLDLGR